MTNSKRTAIIFALAALLGSNGMPAFAQEAAATPAVTAGQPAPGFFEKMKAKFGGRDGGRKGGGQMMQKLMIEVDADKNGSVTQEEVNAFRATKLASTDTSKDGALSLEEFSVAYNEMMRNRTVNAFQRLDDDGNGSITPAELDARFGGIIANMDRNGDGALSKADRPKHEGNGARDRENQNN